MTIQKRSILIAVFLLFVSVLYGAARHYSPSLILFVVEQSLVQKAPSGTDLTRLHERFHQFLSAIPDQNSRMEKLLHISQFLEKVQQLTQEDLNELLEVKKLETVSVR
jgi:hypothetical protein